jgi:hypothetical protein
MTAGMFGLIVAGLILLLAYLEEKWRAKKIQRHAAASGGIYHRASPPATPILPYRHGEGSGYGYDEPNDADEDVWLPVESILLSILLPIFRLTAMWFPINIETF